MLDETDSGLDIDALKTVAEGVNAMRAPRARHRRGHPLPAAAQLHRARLRPRAERRPASCKSGGKELALELEEKGYGWLEQGAAGMSSAGRLRARRAPGRAVSSRSSRLQSDRRPAGPAWLEQRAARRHCPVRGARLPDDPATRNSGSRTSRRSPTTTFRHRALRHRTSIAPSLPSTCTATRWLPSWCSSTGASWRRCRRSIACRRA